MGGKTLGRSTLTSVPWAQPAATPAFDLFDPFGPYDLFNSYSNS